MKDYKEIAAEVFARRDEYLIKQKKRRKTVSVALSLCAAICVVIGVTVAYSRLSGRWVTDIGSTGEEILSLMNTPTVPIVLPTEEPTAPHTDIPPDGADKPPYAGTPVPVIPFGPDKGGMNKAVAEMAGAAKSDMVVYATVDCLEVYGNNARCTLSVEKTLKGDAAEKVYFNISESDREGFMALITGEKAVFFLSEGESGLYLTHGSPSIFYEAGEDDFRSYDEAGLICYYLTMSEIEMMTEAGL